MEKTHMFSRQITSLTASNYVDAHLRSASPGRRGSYGYPLPVLYTLRHTYPRHRYSYT